jgi:hypothetical protein
MAEMTEQEADALDELWTKTTPKIKVGAGGGFFAEHRISNAHTAIPNSPCAPQSLLCRLFGSRR